MTAPLPRRHLGRTGIELTCLGLGAGNLGNSPKVVSDERARAVMDAAWEAGIRYIDTAPLYGHGLSEHRAGGALRRRARDGFVLSTKVGRLLRPEPSGKIDEGSNPGHFKEPLPFSLVEDYSYDGVMRSIEDSLQRLGLARIDIALIHNIDPANHPHGRVETLFQAAMSGAYRALERLRNEGSIGAFGVGNNTWEMCLRFADAGDFDCFMIANGYSLLDQSAADRFLAVCAARDLGVLVASPFCTGILATGAVEGARYRYRTAPAEILNRVRRIERICLRHSVPLPAVALQFPLQHPSIAAVVAGCTTPEEVHANAAHMRAGIPQALWQELESEAHLDGSARN